MLVVLGGSFLGVVFFFGGISGAFNRLRQGMRTVRLRKRGVTVDAEVLSRRDLPETGPDGFAVTAQWTWGGKNYTGDFQVSNRWWEDHGGTSIPIRINPDRPRTSTVAHGTGRAVGKLLVGTAFLIMAVVGLGFLFRSLTVACDQTQLDFLGSVCNIL